MDSLNFSTDAAPITSDIIRNESLVKRLRALLHTFPLFALSQSDSRRDEAFRHYDTLTIALKILDVIAERMGVEFESDPVEANRDYIDFSLAPLLDAMDRRAGIVPDETRHLQMIDRVLAALRNDNDARRPFKLTYTDLDETGIVVERQLEFRLIQDAFGLSGEPIMRLTNEAVNLCFNALELDLEDSQAATEAIVHSQMKRGRFDDARRSAHYAWRQSRMYCDRLRRLLRDTQRDISRVDWVELAPQLIQDAMAHIEARLDVEQNIIRAAGELLDTLKPGSAECVSVAKILSSIQFCVASHTVLQRELMTARTTFLDSQAQQAFAVHGAVARPDLMREVLAPILAMPVANVQNILNRTLPVLSAPAAPHQLSLLSLFDGLLRPKRALRRDWIEIEPLQADHFVGDISRHSQQDRDIVEHLLKSLLRKTTLSELLRYARSRHFTSAQCEVIVLLVMQHFDLESTEKPIVTVQKADFLLADEEYYGDDVWIAPAEAFELPGKSSI